VDKRTEMARAGFIFYFYFKFSKLRLPKSKESRATIIKEAKEGYKELLKKKKRKERIRICKGKCGASKGNIGRKNSRRQPK
jgi:hypothetical protein